MRIRVSIIFLLALLLAVQINRIEFKTEKTKSKPGPIFATPGATALHPDLQSRFDAAQAAAKQEGVNLYIQSGYRSFELQKKLFSDAIAKYGSADEASKWVSPPNISRHPLGLAIDVNYPADPSGANWLDQNGFKFGLYLSWR